MALYSPVHKKYALMKDSFSGANVKAFESSFLTSAEATAQVKDLKTELEFKDLHCPSVKLIMDPYLDEKITEEMLNEGVNMKPAKKKGKKKKGKKKKKKTTK